MIANADFKRLASMIRLSKRKDCRDQGSMRAVVELKKREQQGRDKQGNAKTEFKKTEPVEAN